MPSLGPMIDELYEMREQKRALEASIVEVEEKIRIKEGEVMAELELQGLDRAAGHMAHVGVNETVVPRVEDRDKFFAFIRRHNAFELLECRPSGPAYREWAGRRKDKTVPGVVPFLKRKLSLTVNS